MHVVFISACNYVYVWRRPCGIAMDNGMHRSALCSLALLHSMAAACCLLRAVCCVLPAACCVPWNLHMCSHTHAPAARCGRLRFPILLLITQLPVNSADLAGASSDHGLVHHGHAAPRHHGA